jgi:sulfite exporter TauE/SafE
VRFGRIFIGLIVLGMGSVIAKNEPLFGVAQIIAGAAIVALGITRKTDD